MGRIILVRHGETDWNRELRIQGGSSDTPLNEKGRRQAEDLALRLNRDRIQAVYSSPLKRALETAEAIARYHQLGVVVEPLLREIEAGTLEGVTAGELGKRFSELLTQDGVSKKIPGGESLTELQQRCWGCIEQISRKHIDGDLVVVSHYFTILSIICSALMLPLSRITRLRLSTGSISVINLNGKEARLELFNDTSCLTK
jgi:probable phosphoglycerate mutase